MPNDKNRYKETTLGFKPQDEINENSKMLSSIQELDEKLNKEIYAFDNFENEIRREFKRIEDMKANLEIIHKRYCLIIKLVHTRDEVLKVLLSEWYQPKISVNIEKCKIQIAMLKKLDDELKRMIESVIHYLSKFVIPDFHKLYLESEDAREKIGLFARQATDYSINIEKMITVIQTSQQTIGKIDMDVRQLDFQRSRS